jgi:hypothetical protein
MSSAFIKRALTWSIPAAMVFFAIQYHDTGRLNAYAMIATLAVFLLGGVAYESLDLWWKRTFGTTRLALALSALFWTGIATGMFVFFYRVR